MRDSDLVLTATERVRTAVLREAPAALRRTFTLLEFDPLASSSTASSFEELVTDAARRRATVGRTNLDIPDPMGRPADAHAVSASIAAGAVDRLAPVLVRVAGVRSAN